PEGVSSLLLTRILGHRRASELLLLGEKFGADTAREMGIVNEMVEGDVFARAMDRATALAQQAPRAVMQSKALMKAPYRDALREVMEQEAKQFAEALRSPEAAEAFRAFFEKRTPNFE
ncbi:MAG: enoyl-CoA hydratase-related protein, partial [Myxococcota bacterium]